MATPKGMPVEVLRALARYYIAHWQDDTDWVVLPVVSFDAWLGPSFGKTCGKLQFFYGL